MSATATPHSARFRPGDRVRIDARHALGHCRTPFYLRGRTGVVTEIQGTFRAPELLAYHRPGLPAKVLYKVRFRQSDLWDGYRGARGDRLEADIYEDWLLPAGR